MISVKQLIYKTKLRLNKLATNDHQDIPVEDILFSANEQQIKLVKKKVSQNNIYQLGLDSFKKRYQDLQNLIVQSEEYSEPKKGTDTYTFYKVDTSKLKNNWFFFIGLTAVCTKGKCKDRPLAITKLIEHADLQTMMNNTNYSPSFEYQETIALLSGDEIYIYTDGTFEVTKVYITYLKYPQKIDLEGYIDLEGNPSITKDSELDEFLEDELLDLIQLDLAINTENMPSIQGAEIKLKTNE